MKDLVHGVVLGALARHAGALELVLPSGHRVPAVWLQTAVLVVSGTGPEQLQGVRNIPLHNFLTGRPVIQNGNVVPQRPAGAAGCCRGPLTEVTKLGVGSDLQRQMQKDQPLGGSLTGPSQGGLEVRGSHKSSNRPLGNYKCAQGVGFPHTPCQHCLISTESLLGHFILNKPLFREDYVGEATSTNAGLVEKRRQNERYSVNKPFQSYLKKQ